MTDLLVLAVFTALFLSIGRATWPQQPSKPKPQPRSEAVVHHSCGRGHEYRATIRDAMRDGCPDCAVIDGIIDRVYDACSREVRP